MFEQAAVFERGIGEVTDVVEKELFLLAPREEDGERWALRPEPTAGLVRAYVQHGMQTWPQPVKLTMIGPMFRYDRPQAGRYRQFWQFDVEVDRRSGTRDRCGDHRAGRTLLPRGGPAGRLIQLNSIGDPACRPGLHRGAHRVLPGACRGAAAARARAPGAEPAADPRFEGRGGRGAERGRAAIDRPAVRRVRRALRGRPRAPRRARRRVPARAAPRPRARLLHAHGVRGLPRGRDRPAIGDRRRRALRRARGAARRAPDARHRVRDRARSGAARGRGAGGRGRRRTLGSRTGADRGRRRDGPRRHADAPANRDRAARGRACREGGPGLTQARQAARGRRPRPGALRGHHRRRAPGGDVQLRDLEAGTQRAVPAANLARELERATKSHRHGVAPDETNSRHRDPGRTCRTAGRVTSR